ncbi:MAG: guanylate kinase [Marinilabiliaceae bacterium]|nr:guanylate kinase [Marinilabiliaceae bacterium]
MNKILIFSAPSGSGKSTIINHLLTKGLPIEFSISATSRAPRGNEKHGKEYYFLTSEEFRNRINNDDFVEYEEVYSGCFYGTLKSELTRVWGNNNSIVFDVDVKGGENLKRIFGDNALSIFIMPPSVEELRRRLIGRATDSMEKIEQRVAKASEEIEHSCNFDKVVINDNLDAAKSEAEQIVREFLAYNE